ncbi:MAG: hypothetical protein ACRYGR_00370 [Janthinobacterium lividum]
MAAPKFLIDAWTSNGIFGSVEAVDRTTKRLQTLGLVPRSSKKGEALLLWEPEHHVNMLLSMILQDTSSTLPATLDMWKSVKPSRRLAFRTFEDMGANSLERHARAYGIRKARDLLGEVNKWEVDLLVAQGKPAEAKARSKYGLPSQIVPGATFGEALAGLIDRLSSTENKELYFRAQADNLAIALSWGSNQYAGAKISYQSSVTASGGPLLLFWEGAFDTEEIIKAGPGVTHSIEFGDVLLMELAHIWQETKAARAAQASR